MEGLVEAATAHFAGRCALVTGAAGFIGRHLTATLLAAGTQVNIIETPSADLDPLKSWLVQQGLSPHRLQYHPVDIRDESSLRQTVHECRPDYVFHLAAVGVTQPFLPLELAMAVNLQGSINLFRSCFPDGPVKLVHTGTPYEYGDRDPEPYPISHYAASKAAAFAMARMYHRTQQWPIVTVRPFQVYGPGQVDRALIPSAIQAARTGAPFLMTGGEQARDFIYVSDVVHGYLLAAAKGVAGRSYDLGWGQTRTLKQVITRLYALLGAAGGPQLGALPYRPGEVWHLQANPQPAADDLDWHTVVDLDQGLLSTIRDNAIASGPISPT